MIVTVAMLLILCAGVIVGTWQSRRAWRHPGRIGRWVRTLLAGAFTLVCLLALVLLNAGLYELYRPRSNPPTRLQTVASNVSAERGQHLAQFLCVECHATNGRLPLSGGSDMSAGNPFFGSFVPSNLTGDRLKDWSDAEIARLVREGVNRDERASVIMGYTADRFRKLSDDDMQSIIMYLRSQTAAGSDTPVAQPGPLAAVEVILGTFPLSTAPVTMPVASPPKAPTAAYGGYIVSYAGCISCHGDGLARGGAWVDPSGSNLQTSLRTWTREEFITTMRTGVAPTGRMLNPKLMPWEDIRHLDDVELEALYTYLRAQTQALQLR